MTNPKLQPMMVTIGYIRDDGDLAVLATLNNIDEHVTREGFNELVAKVLAFYTENPATAIAEDVKAYVRYDAPDYAPLVDEEEQVEWEQTNWNEVPKEAV